jgi:hypothetical protein
MTITLDGTLGITSPAETIATNLTFTGTGNRITGDMSTTAHVNRVSFQSNVVNGATSPFIIPNGTGTTASIVVANASDPTNSSFGQLAVTASTDVKVISGLIGTGTYLPMTFYTGGSERARIDTSGNVGIGTSSPDVNLDVTKTSDGIAARFQRSSGGGIVDIETYNAIGGIGTSDNIPFRLNTNNTERMRIDSSGNVGIGTSSPATELHVNGGLIAGSQNSQTHPDTSSIGGFKAQWNYLNGSAETDFYNLYSAADTSFRFWQTTGNGTATALCDINADGRFAFNSGYGSVATAYGCRAWVNFNGTGTVAIRASGNVSSITDNGLGNYLVNFTTAMPDANYSWSGACMAVGNSNLVMGNNSAPLQTTTALSIMTVAAAVSLIDAPYVNVSVFR